MSGQRASARLDVWLWRARFFKSRSLAARHVVQRGVRVTRDGRTQRVAKAAVEVVEGDVLTFAVGPRIHVVEIAAMGVRRGPAEEARGLYRVLDGGAS